MFAFVLRAFVMWYSVLLVCGVFHLVDCECLGLVVG